MTDPTPAAVPFWVPPPERIRRSQLRCFAEEAVAAGAPPEVRHDYAALHRWSVEARERFWPLVWGWGGVVADELGGGRCWDEVLVGRDRLAPPDPVRGPRWFTGARLNVAENLLRWGDDRLAIAGWDEAGPRARLTHAALRAQAARVAAALRAEGVGPGDRVAAIMPNIAETVIAMLGAAAVGAAWTSCSPDFGVQGIIDRFGQVGPVVLVTVDGYRYAGKRLPLADKVAEVTARLPGLRRVVSVPWLGDAPHAPGATAWGDWLAPHDGAVPRYERLPFDHPLYVLYSSGTTGLPKCMVHGAGGTLLQHLKEHLLHGDVTRDDRVFYFTTCGWMMWNWLVSVLATGAAIVLYDGAPLQPRPEVLWDLAAAEGVTVFGTSAKYLALAEKAGLRPAATHDLRALRAVLSTGSPLASHSFDWVRGAIGAHVHLASISGGTDLVSCFALGVPTLPVWRGELQGPGLGMAVDVVDGDGRPVRGTAGELVCRAPFPSMPVRFWGDPDGARYRRAYFERFDGVWAHGDWAEWTAHGGLVIHGRSDATLNPGGVRIGTAEIYRQVESLPEVIESVVIGQPWDGDVRIVLFVRLREGVVLDDALAARLRQRIREGASPHHVPRVIVAVDDVPRTLNGKVSELAVRDAVLGRAVGNAVALANPGSLAFYEGWGRGEGAG